jgi:hypothetical protein
MLCIIVYCCPPVCPQGLAVCMCVVSCCVSLHIVARGGCPSGLEGSAYGQPDRFGGISRVPRFIRRRWRVTQSYEN